MPLISDNSNTRSAFPSGIDVFTSYHDGTGVDSVIDAEIWDKIETAIYRTQSHAQPLLHVQSRHVDSNFKRITISTTGAVSVSALTVSFDVVLNTEQMALLSNTPFRWMNSIYAHVYALTGSQQSYLVTPFPVTSNTVRVQFRNMDLITFVPVGTYSVDLTIVGI